MTMLFPDPRGTAEAMVLSRLAHELGNSIGAIAGSLAVLDHMVADDSPLRPLLQNAINASAEAADLAPRVAESGLENAALDPLAGDLRERMSREGVRFRSASNTLGDAGVVIGSTIETVEAALRILNRLREVQMIDAELTEGRAALVFEARAVDLCEPTRDAVADLGAEIEEVSPTVVKLWWDRA